MYKGLEVYCCLALNRIAQQLGIDLNQAELEAKLDEILKDRNKGVPKVELSYELRSNHYMTNKVLEVLEEEGLVTVEKVTDGREYQVKIILGARQLPLFQFEHHGWSQVNPAIGGL